MDVAPGTIVIWSDLSCPFAHVAVSRLHRWRTELGLDPVVRFDHRAFPLELVNEEPTSKRHIDAEVPVLSDIEPDAGWKPWATDLWTWPVTTLPALEAVQAAKEQGLSASEELDRALRVAFFVENRCISLRSVIIDVAHDCLAVDEDALAGALDDGRARHTVIDQWRAAQPAGVKGSPHLFLPDGSDVANPGLTVERGPSDAVTIAADDADVYRHLLAPFSTK